MELIKQAIEFHKTGNFLEAEKYYLQFLKEKPNEAKAHHLLGLLYFQNKEFNQAVLSFKHAIKLEKSPEFYTNLGLSYFELFDFNNALKFFKKALKFEQSTLLLEKIIACTRELNLEKEFVKYGRIYAQNNPVNSDFLYDIAKAAFHIYNFKTSLEFSKKAIEADPNNANAYNNLGLTLELKSHFKEAEIAYKKAIELRYDPPYYYNYSVLLKRTRRLDEAEALLQQLMRDKNASDEVQRASRFSWGLMRLHKKDFDAGFKHLVEFFTHGRERMFPRWWDGNPNPEFSLVVYETGGFGDFLMYSRYLDLIDPSKFKQVTFAVPRELYEFFKFNFPSLNVIQNGEKTTCSAGVLLFQLPLVLNVGFDKIPSPEKYLMAPPEHVEKHKNKFDEKKFNVGIFYASKHDYERTLANRTIPKKFLSKLFNIENVKFYSLQPEKKFSSYIQTTEMVDLSSEIKNFADTAGIIESLDVVVSVDSSVIHLAGALGKKSLLMLPWSSEWRWFDSNDKCDWYESVEIFRQPKEKDWADVIRRIRARIEELAREKMLKN